MTLDRVLARIQGLHHLPALLAELGCQSAWETLPDEFWHRHRREHRSASPSALIGWAGPLPWFGVEGRPTADLARSLAQLLLRRGEIGGVAVVDPGAGRLSLTVAFERLPVLTLSLTDPEPIHIACLHRLAEASSGGLLARAARVADVLSGEGIGLRFFSAFEAQLERMAAAIEGHVRAEDRRSLALLQLNRVLFLYFIQSKGWLDSRTDFLRVEVDRCLARRKHLHRALLQPLFFGTLNREIRDRSTAARKLGAIPFLNGGLFEPHPLERRWRGSIPNPVWRDAFDHLFERFHFTAGEGSQSSIAPDMLGRVFEGVMAPAERRHSGTFYTPPTVVREVIDESLVALAVERLGCSADQARELLQRRDPLLQPLLESLTLLDPAVGSGAFLLGALERLAELRGNTREPPHSIRRQILLRNLFGVDINPTAVRLTELRLWLAVIADDPTEEIGAVHPLPNLDCLVRQGDSLSDPLALIARMPFRAGAMGSALGKLREVLVVSTGQGKREAARALRQAEVTAMKECLAQAESQLERSIQESLHIGRTPDLFGAAPDGRIISGRVRELRSRWIPIRQARRRLERDGEVPWFQYESHFADVFAQRGGFDLVVGNPPWVRAEQLTPVVREQLAERYHWWRSEGRPVTGYRHQPDLSVAFLERAHELAAPRGVVGLLLPAKIATAGYGAAARRGLARDLTLHVVSDLSGGEKRFDATVYPMVVISGKTRPPREHLVRLALNSPAGSRIPQTQLQGGAPWILKYAEAGVLGRALAARHPSIGERYRIHLGLKTGANHVFLTSPDEIEPGLIRRAFRGRDLAPFRVTRSISLLWPCTDRGEPLDRLPPRAALHFQKHSAALIHRKDYKRGPPWRLFRTGPATASHRVVWADLAPRLIAVALSGETHREMIPLNTCYVMPVATGSEAGALAAWLNSTWIRGLARSGADPASGGFARFNATAVSRLPLPASVPGDSSLSRFAENAARDPFNQDELDELAAIHLDLSSTERRSLAAVAGAGPRHRR